MRTFLLTLLLAVSFCTTSFAQDNKEIYERAKEWQERMNNVRNRGEVQRPNIQPRLQNDKHDKPDRPMPPANFDRGNHIGRPFPPQFNGWQHPGFRPPVGYFPVVQWYPYGTWMNVGPVVVSPDRRYVRFGINAGFSEYRGFDTFNFYNGETRNHRR